MEKLTREMMADRYIQVNENFTRYIRVVSKLTKRKLKDMANDLGYQYYKWNNIMSLLVSRFKEEEFNRIIEYCDNLIKETEEKNNE